MLCDRCGKNPPIIHITGEGSYCADCNNQMMLEMFGKDNTFHYDAQIEHYSEYIEKHPGWELAGIYADDGISASGFENVIAYHADQFRENGVPFLFVQPPKDDDDARIRAYIDVTTDLCRQRSISFVSAEDVTGGKLVSLVREDKKAE